ncbi:hypothetical protein, partial [Nocardioides sp.]|uniref:hypothetical protein n=1 Tax=Nocardioides sp. TaxID=35761 RepID=UPI003518AFC8
HDRHRQDPQARALVRLILLTAAALMTVGGDLWWDGSPDAPFGPLLAGLGVALFIVLLRPSRH